MNSHWFVEFLVKSWFSSIFNLDSGKLFMFLGEVI
jgi:hypothetical protein